MKRLHPRGRTAVIVGVLLAAAVVTAATCTPSRAGGAVPRQTGGGELGPDYVRATAADLGAGTYGGSSPVPATQPSTTPIYTWIRVATDGRCVLASDPVDPELARLLTPLPGFIGLPFGPARIAPVVDAPPGAMRYDRPGPLPGTLTYVGDTVSDIGFPVAWDRDVVIVPRCVLPGDPPPPSPPTAAEIWQQTLLPRARIHANPPGTRAWPGVVHLQSRFWSEALPEAVASVALPGFAVDVRAVAVAYAWVPGDGSSTVRAGPGGPTDYVGTDFLKRGDYPVTLYVVWAGVAHLWMPDRGLDLGAQWLGTVTLPEQVVHHVAEVRALLHS
jgi:hypothetical protein